MRVFLATLVLNELEWLPKLVEQHRNWPGLVGWCFVEGADVAYAQANPEMVSKDGLSVDGTTEFLEYLTSRYCGDHSICTHIRHGLSRHSDIAQGKCEARNRYLDVAEQLKPDVVVILDCDEMYPYASQEALTHCMRPINCRHSLGFCYRQREIWRPPSCSHMPLLSQEVVGGLWKMHHCHVWRYVKGMKYERSHVWPQLSGGGLMSQRMARFDNHAGSTEWLHLGWASQARTREAKIKYYHARGEGVTDHRKSQMECRDAWLDWKPGDSLPHGARVIPYSGPVPEVFRNEVPHAS